MDQFVDVMEAAGIGCRPTNVLLQLDACTVDNLLNACPAGLDQCLQLLRGGVHGVDPHACESLPGFRKPKNSRGIRVDLSDDCTRRRIAPIGRHLLPVTNVGRALGFGMVWGWMPCGFAYTVMLIALAYGARRAASLAAGGAARRVAGTVLICSAALTVLAPQIVAASPWLHPWVQYLCRVDAP